MSAQRMHSGPGPSISSRLPVPPHAVQAQSLIGAMTMSWGGLLCRSIRRSRLLADSSGETQCVR